MPKWEPVTGWSDIPDITVIDGNKQWTLKGLAKWPIQSMSNFGSLLREAIEKGDAATPEFRATVITEPTKGVDIDYVTYAVAGTAVTRASAWDGLNEQARKLKEAADELQMALRNRRAVAIVITSAMPTPGPQGPPEILNVKEEEASGDDEMDISE